MYQRVNNVVHMEDLDFLSFWSNERRAEDRYGPSCGIGYDCLSEFTTNDRILKTGDIVLLSGMSFSSELIRFATMSDWSHVAMVIKNPTSCDYYLFESRLRTGVSLTPLEKHLSEYKAVAVRPIKRELSTEQERLLHCYVESALDRPFQKDFRSIVDTVLGHWSYRRSLFSGAFEPHTIVKSGTGVVCSELVVDTLDQLGFDMGKRPTCTYAPHDFCRETSVATFAATNASMYDAQVKVDRLYYSR